METTFPQCVLNPQRPNLKEISLIKVVTVLFRNAINTQKDYEQRERVTRENIHQLGALPQNLIVELLNTLPAVLKEFYEGSYYFMNGTILSLFGIVNDWSPVSLLMLEPELPSAVFESSISNVCKMFLACHWCLREKIEYYIFTLTDAELLRLRNFPDAFLRFWLAVYETNSEDAMEEIGKPADMSLYSFGFRMSVWQFDYVPMKYFWFNLDCHEKEIELNVLCDQMEILRSYRDQICYFILFLSKSTPYKITRVCHRYPQIPLILFMHSRYRRDFRAVVDYFLPLAFKVDLRDLTHFLPRMLRDARLFCDEITLKNFKYFLNFENYQATCNYGVGEYFLLNPRLLANVIELVVCVKQERCAMILLNFLLNYDRLNGLRLTAALYSESFESEDNIYGLEGILSEMISSFVVERKLYALRRFLRMFTITAPFAETVFQRLNTKFVGEEPNHWYVVNGRHIVLNILNDLIIWNFGIESE